MTMTNAAPSYSEPATWMPERPYWWAAAACRGKGPDLFFADAGDLKATAAALQFCAVCPVRPECAAAGERQDFGIWGGQLAKRRKRVPRSCVVCGAPVLDPLRKVVCSSACRDERHRQVSRESHARRRA